MQFDKVVIAVDFSAASLAAARWAAMQLASRAELALVHVVTAPMAPSFVRPHLPSLEEVAEGLTPALHGALRGLAEVVGSSRTTIELLTGTPADALATFGRAFGADLICLGRRRRRRGAARFGDTTAQRLLAQTRIPVLVVPAARPTLPARILTAVDDQPGCATDLRAALGIARSYEATLELLHVLSPELPGLVALTLGATGIDGDGDADADAERSAPAELYLRGKTRLESLTHDWLALQVRDVGEGVRRVTTHVRIGDPGEQIVRFVRAACADLVVIGRGRDAHTVRSSTGTTGSGGALRLGSTSRLVLWASPSPVLVLPPASRPVRPEPARRLDARRLHVGTTSVRRPSTTSSRRDMMGPDDCPPAALLSDSLRTRTATSAA
jgi:nucleotide-binding universal stress UspA family protein